jgi:hypothetical protein
MVMKSSLLFSALFERFLKYSAGLMMATALPALESGEMELTNLGVMESLGRPETLLDLHVTWIWKALRKLSRFI